MRPRPRRPQPFRYDPDWRDFAALGILWGIGLVCLIAVLPPLARAIEKFIQR